MDQSSPNTHADALPLRLATAPVNWNNTDIPDWRPTVPFPAILDLMHDAGYRATEYDGSFGTDPGQLNTEANARDMTWCGCYQWVDFLDADHIEPTITGLVPKLQLLAEIGCHHLIVADVLRPDRVALAGRVPADGSRSLTDDEVERLAHSVHALADTAGAFGVAVHFHNHVGSWIEAPHEVQALLRHLDTSRVSLCFDTGHYAYGGGDAATFIRGHIDAIGYLHLKDVDTGTVASARQRKLTFIEALKEFVFSPLGEGSADIPSILDTLVDARFSGWVVIEQDTCRGDSSETAHENLSYVRNRLAGAGPATSGRTAS